MRGWLRRKRFWAAVLGAAAILAAAGWLVFAESAARLALGRLAALSQGRVVCEAPRGSLRGPFGCARLSVRGPRFRVTALEVTLEPDWPALLRGQVAGRALRAESALYEWSASQEEPEAPATLAPPVAFSVEALALGELTIRGPGAPIVLREIRGRVDAGHAAHALGLALASPWGELSGEAKLAAEPPFAIEGALRFARREAPAGELTAALGGSLIDLQLTLRGTLAGAELSGDAAIASFSAARVRRLALHAVHADLAAFFEKAPHSDAALALALAPGPDGALAGELKLENARPGPFSASALPLHTLRAELREVSPAAFRVESLAAAFAPRGSARGTGEYKDGALALRLTVESLDLAALHAALIETRLAGSVSARFGAGEVRGELELRDPRARLAGRVAYAGAKLSAEGIRLAARGGELNGEASAELGDVKHFAAQLRFARFDPSAFGAFPSARLSGTLEASGGLGEDWSASLRATLAGSRFRGRALSGGGTLELAAGQRWRADLALALGGNRATLRGQFGAPGDALALTLDADELAALGEPFAGRARARATLRGTRARPSGSFAIEGAGLRLPSDVAIASLDAAASLGEGAARPLELSVRASGFARGRAVVDAFEANARGPLAEHTLALSAKGPEIDARAELRGGLDERWSGTLLALENATEPRLELVEPAPLALGPGFLAFGPARLATYQGELAVGSLRYAHGALSSAGVAYGVSAAELLAALGRPADAGSDLTLRGVWIVPEDPREPGTLRLEREAGDLAFGGVALALSAFEMDATIAAERASFSGMLRSQRLGDADLRGELSAPRGATVLSPATRIEGALAARSASLAAAGGVLNLAALVDGTAQLELALGGTLGTPLFSGQLSGDALRLDLPGSGIAIRDGRLRARVEPRAIRVDELTFSGTQGVFHAEGAIALDGTPSQLDWRAADLRVLNRPDRMLTVTGNGSARLADGRAALRGELRVDRGHFEVRGTSSEPLGSDVVVTGREREPARKLDPTLLELDVTLDAGKDLSVRGIGIDTALSGKLRVRSFPDGHLEARGKIDARNGTYRAFGQNLEIEHGQLLFDGPLDDPALDVLAFRRNLAVEAGVELTGTLRLPLARLVSRPPVPDSEKLSWLVLGHGVADASASDLGLLQTAATTVISGSEATPIGQRIARGIGLDEIAIRGSGTELTTQAVAVGKRITRDLYVEYEYGLAVASHLVRLQYTLTRAFSLRAETSGETSSVGVSYRKSWD